MESITAALFGTAAAPATATAAATAATGGLLGFGGKVTLGGLFNTALALGSAGLTLGGALRQSQILQTQGAWSEFQAGQEALRGEQEANRVREALLRTLASNNAARAAAALDVSGTPATVDEEVMAQAERELRVVAGNAAVRAAEARAAAALRQSAARVSLLSGLGQAGGSLVSAAERRLRIG